MGINSMNGNNCATMNLDEMLNKMISQTQQSQHGLSQLSPIPPPTVPPPTAVPTPPCAPPEFGFAPQFNSGFTNLQSQLNSDNNMPWLSQQTYILPTQTQTPSQIQQTLPTTFQQFPYIQQQQQQQQQIGYENNVYFQSKFMGADLMQQQQASFMGQPVNQQQLGYGESVSYTNPQFDVTVMPQQNGNSDMKFSNANMQG